MEPQTLNTPEPPARCGLPGREMRSLRRERGHKKTPPATRDPYAYVPNALPKLPRMTP